MVDYFRQQNPFNCSIFMDLKYISRYYVLFMFIFRSSFQIFIPQVILYKVYYLGEKQKIKHSSEMIVILTFSWNLCFLICINSCIELRKFLLLDSVT